MNAPVATEIQQEAAKSLLERMREKTALVKFFRYNAHAKHAVPIDSDKDIIFWSRGDDMNTISEEKSPKEVVSREIEPKQVVQSVAQMPSEQPVMQPIRPAPSRIKPIIVQSNGNDCLKGALVAVVTLGGMALSGLFGYILANRQPVQQEIQFQQSPLQFLEDIGAHLP